jgi:fermentation-respiration switch protein FrsA (DUF1100 family)
MDQPHRVAFDVAGDTVVGHLYLPQSVSGPVPGLVMAGPMTSVKEQVTGVYAAALAARGFATLALDHRHYGESGGLPRQYERWDRKVEDLSAGVDFLRGHSMVDQGRIGLAAVCLGSGYAAHAALRNPAVRALGLVAGYYRDPAEVEAMDPHGFAAKIEQGVAARLAFEAGEAPFLIPAASLTGGSAMTSVDTVDYYIRRAAVSNYTNASAVMSREWFLSFDVHAAAPDLTIPVCMIHSEQALSPHWARRFYSRLGRPGDLIWLTSRGQTDFYDDPALVGPVSTHLTDHFTRHLT